MSKLPTHAEPHPKGFFAFLSAPLLSGADALPNWLQRWTEAADSIRVWPYWMEEAESTGICQKPSLSIEGRTGP